MKILIIIDETVFFHPKFANELITGLKRQNHQILFGLVTKINKKNSIYYYFLKNIFKFKILEIFLLGTKFFCLSFFKNFLLFFNFYSSVKIVLNHRKINFFEIKKNINKNTYIKKIKKYNPDIIVSSCSTIFSNEILKIPKYGCINRHSALLPSFGGILPVFYSIAYKKKYSGVTIHLMNKKIDGGKILAQKKILNIDKNLHKIYKECFKVSPDLIFKAIENLLKKKFLKPKYRKSYFSFPKKNDWIEFRKNHGKFI